MCGPAAIPIAMLAGGAAAGVYSANQAKKAANAMKVSEPLPPPQPEKDPDINAFRRANRDAGAPATLLTGPAGVGSVNTGRALGG